MKFYVDKNLQIRASETGWPAKPIISAAHIYEEQCEAYDKALEKAKSESVVVLEQDGTPWVNRAETPDSFPEFQVEVDFSYQYKPHPDSDRWHDCHVSVYMEYQHYMKEGQYRKIARLKPVNSAMGYTEGSDLPSAPFPQNPQVSAVQGPWAEPMPVNPFKTFHACNWEEDYTHENGRYINTCIDCKMPFMGHKRRVICKMCAGPDWEALAKKQAPPDNKCAHAGCWGEGEMVGFARCMVKHTIPLRAQIAAAQKRCKELESWQEEEMLVWNPVLDYAQENSERLGINIGQSISSGILRILKTFNQPG